MGLDYGYEKLTSAAHRLVASGSLAKRLELAFVEFHSISKRDLSEEHYTRFESVKNRLANKESSGEGRWIGAILEEMSIEEQEKIAEDILELAFDVNTAFEVQDE